MKMVYVSSSSPDKTNFMYDAFLDLGGIDVQPIFKLSNLKTSFNDTRGVIEKALDKLGRPLDKTQFNKRIYRACVEHNPDVVFVAKGNEIKPGILRKIKNKFPKTKLINWSLDDMYAKHNRTLYYTKNINQYDLIVTTKSYNCNDDELASLGARKVLFQNNSYSPHIHRPCNNCSEVVAKHDVLFIGSAERERAESIYKLASSGISVDVYGAGWSKKEFKVFRHENIRYHEKALLNEEYSNAISCSKISLCFLRKINRDLQTIRTVEIPAAKGFMLAERTDEQLNMFKEGVEAEYFSGNTEMIEKVKFYLEHDKERSTIAENARQRCLDGGYSFTERAKQILSELRFT